MSNETPTDRFHPLPEMPVPEPDPIQIGPYRVLDKLGEGGMGIVYLAEQDSPRRRVALKVIQPERVSPEHLRRFEYETQILGRLQHPGIAQIFEAGTADRHPFFAMEFVQGKPLLAYAQGKGLTTRERLELFVKVCEAVEYAHQKGVIHRDLKPGNILVDGNGQPKVLDFGVARVTDPEVQGPTMHTDAGQLVGTLRYMSPEQAAADPAELDTRSDVYALGIILYLLLAERFPYDLKGKPLPEIIRVICEEEPTPLSSINRGFRGDVATIAARALEKDKTRRYQSAADLAGDVMRYLRDEPILARPASTWYHFRKFARRNRGLVSGAVLAVTALVLGTVLATVGFVQARQESQRVAEAQQKEVALLAQTSFAAGRLAERQGEWDNALKHYQKALDAGYEDDVAVRLHMVRCWNKVDGSRDQQILDELDALAQRSDLKGHQGEVVFARGLMGLNRGRLPEESTELIKKALALGLPPAEAATARAFLSQTMPEAVGHLKEALRHDPFHADHALTLATLLIVLGRRDEAREVIGQFQVLAPNSVEWVACQVLLLASEGNGAAANALVDAHASRVDPETIAMFRFLIKLFALAQNWLRTGEDDISRWITNPLAIDQEMRQLLTRMVNARVRPSNEKVGSPFELPIFHLPSMQIWPHGQNALLSLSLNQRSEAADELAHVVHIAPEGTVYLLHGMLLMYAGRLEEAEKAFVTGSRTPSAFDVRQITRIMLLDVRVQRLARVPEGSKASLKAAAVETLRELMSLGPLPKERLEKVLLIALQLGEKEGLHPALAEWARLAPNDPSVLVGAASGYLIIGAYDQALKLVQEIRKRDPQNKTAGEIEDKALEALRQTFKTAAGELPSAAWDATRSQQALALQRHAGLSSRVGFRADGQGVTLYTFGDVVYLQESQDRETFSTAKPLKGPLDQVLCTALSPDAMLLAAGGRDRSVKIWDSTSAKLVHSLEGHPQAVVSICFSANGERLAAGEQDGRVTVWDVTRDMSVVSFKPHTARLVAVCFSPDGKLVASAALDQTVKIWDLTANKEASVLKPPLGPVSLCFSPDGKRLVVGCPDGKARVHETATGKEVLVLQMHRAPVSSLCFSPDGKRLATGGYDEAVRVCDPQTGQFLGSLRSKGLIIGLAYSPDGKHLASAEEAWSGTQYYHSGTKIWAGASDIVFSVEGNTGEIRTVAYSPDGKRLATAGVDQTVRVWDSATGKQLLQLQGGLSTVNGVAFSADGKLLASASWDRNLILWDAATGRSIRSFEGHKQGLYCVCFSPDGKLLASSGGEKADQPGEVKLWDVGSGKELLDFKGHAGWVRCVSFSPDGKRLATACTDKVARVWDVATGKMLGEFKGHTSYVNGIAFSPDGSRLATGSGDGTVRIWDQGSGKQLQSLRGHTGAVFTVGYSADGKRLASADGSGGVRVWSAEGQLLFPLRGHASTVYRLAFSPDGKHLAAPGADQTVKVWRLPGE